MIFENFLKIWIMILTYIIHRRVCNDLYLNFRNFNSYEVIKNIIFNLRIWNTNSQLINYLILWKLEKIHLLKSTFPTQLYLFILVSFAISLIHRLWQFSTLLLQSISDLSVTVYIFDLFYVNSAHLHRQTDLF